MKNLIKISTILLMAFSLVACRKESDRIHDFSHNDDVTFGAANNSFGDQFKLLWEALNSNYAIWDYEAEQGLDWDEVYETYYPKFVELDTLVKTRQITDEEFTALVKAVIAPLHDGHLAIDMKNRSTGNFINVNPGDIRIHKERAQEMKDLDSTFLRPSLQYYQDNGTVKEFKTADATLQAQFNETVGAANKWISDNLNYLSAKTVVTQEELNTQRTAQDLQAELGALEKLTDNKQVVEGLNKIVHRYSYMNIPGFHVLDPALSEDGIQMTYALLDRNIAYFSFSGFNIDPFLTSLPEQAATMEPYAAELVQQMKGVWESWFYAIQELHKAGQLGGVIIDVRCNGGGNSGDFAYVLGALVPSGGLHIMNARFKRGVGRYDYSPVTPMIMPTYPGDHVTVTEPIVVLANAKSVSMAEITSIGTRQVENAKLIGTRTWGGLCALTDNSAYSIDYSGKVGVEGVTPVFAYCPLLAALDLESGKPIEGIGMTPDIEVQLDLTAWNKGKGPDSQLDRAIEYIVNGK